MKHQEAPMSVTTTSRAGLAGLAAALVALLALSAAPASASTFTTTGSLAEARSHHMAVLLPDGEVLAAGGFSFGSVLASAERYDPATGAWSPAAAMSSPREDASLALLPSGE